MLGASGNKLCPCRLASFQGPPLDVLRELGVVPILGPQ